MNEHIIRLKKNIAYSYMSGDTQTDRRNCTDAVCKSESHLAEALAQQDLSAREIKQLVEVLCSRVLYRDNESPHNTSLARQIVLLTLVRAQSRELQPALTMLSTWMSRNEADSVLRSHLRTRLLGMPHHYVTSVLLDTLQFTRSQERASC